MSVIDTILERFDGALAPLFARRISDDAEDSDSGKAKDMFGFVTKVNDGEQNSDGSITISGVLIPRIVADQLKKLGASLSFMNTGQLEAAIENCAVDCNLIDDPEGNSFFDDMELDDSEKDKDEEEEELDEELYRRNALRPGHGNVFVEPSEATGSVFFDPQFREKIKNEREQQRERRKRALSKEDDGSSTDKTQSSPHMSA